MPEWAFVALGSNLGDRAAHLAFGVRHLDRLPDTTVERISSVEETEPLGGVEQGPYLNQMVLLRTALPAEDLLAACLAGESRAGRTRTAPWGPRTLDLDIVRYGDATKDEPGLVIPHPQVASRPFWLRELAELAPATFPSEGAALPPWAQVGDGRRRHIERVAGLLAAWAMARGMPPDERRRWLRAGFLHDAVRDAPADTLARLAGDAWESPSLRHGPAAAVLAEEAGETDRGVLDAVRFHSVGYAGWDDVGRMLYLADYLEPGRSHRRAHRAELAGRVPADPEGTLRAVADERRRWLESSGLPAPPESIAFWTALREDA